MGCRHGRNKYRLPKKNVGLYNRGDSMVYFQVQNFSGSNGAEGYTTRTNFSFVDYAAAYTSVVFNAKVKLLGEVKRLRPGP